MDIDGPKTRKRSSREIQDVENQNVEDSSHNVPNHITQNQSPQSNDVSTTLKEIQKTIAQIMAMKQVASSSYNSHCKWPIVEGMLKTSWRA